MWQRGDNQVAHIHYSHGMGGEDKLKAGRDLNNLVVCLHSLYDSIQTLGPCQIGNWYLEHDCFGQSLCLYLSP